MRVGLNILHFTLLVMLTGVVTLGMTLFFALQGSLPQREGIAIVENLEQKVDIRRDAAGMPSIESTDRESVLFGLGFVHAQDQFLTMDLLRRASVGRLSELLGLRARAADQQRLYYGLEAVTQQLWQQATATEKAMLTAYSEGVNAGLRQQSQPPLFYKLRSFQPQPWQPEDALRVLLSFLTLPHEPELLTALMNDPTKQTSDPDMGSVPHQSTRNNTPPTLTRTLTQTPDGFQLSILSTSRLPILEPWYSIRWRTFAQSPWAQGITLPGLPMLLMGRHDQMAWALNAAPEPPFQWLRLAVKDEQFWHPEWGWTDFEYQTHTRSEDASAPVFRQTPWGPVLGSDDQGDWLVLSWPGLSAQNLSLAWLQLDQLHAAEALLKQMPTLAGAEWVAIDHHGSWALSYLLAPVQHIQNVHPEHPLTHPLGVPRHAVLQASRLEQPVSLDAGNSAPANTATEQQHPPNTQPAPWLGTIEALATPALWQHPLMPTAASLPATQDELAAFELTLTLAQANIDWVAGQRRQSWHPLQPYALQPTHPQALSPGPTRFQLTLIPGR